MDAWKEQILPKMSAQKTLLDVILETLETIDRYKRDPTITPNVILDSVHTRVCLMLKKMISTPTCTSYCIFKPVVQPVSSAPVVLDGTDIC